MRVANAMCFFALIVSVSCTFSPKSDFVLARVGNEVLTVDEVERALGSSYSPENAQRYIQEWVDVTLLAHEARKMKLDRSKEYKFQKNFAENQLLASLLLESDLKTSQGGSIDSLTVLNYFDNHRLDYVRQETAYQICSLVYDDLITAWEARKEMDHGAFFREAQRQNQGNPVDFARLPFVTYSQIDTTVVTYVTSLPVGEISMPRLVQGKAYIYWLVAVAPKGTACTLDEVLDQVRKDASVNSYQESVAAYKERLRKSKKYHYNEKAVERFIATVKGAPQ